MKLGRLLGLGVLAAALALDPARADYYSDPEIRPENRCVTDDGTPFANAGIDPIHCQRLFWDLPVSTAVGTVAAAAPFDEDPVPRFPNGLTDRVPPMWVGTLPNLTAEGFEYENDCTANATGCHRLCPELEIPYWKEILNEDGSPVLYTDVTRHDAADPTKPLTGPRFELQCRRGTRAYFGPWQTGTQEEVFDRCFGCGDVNMVHFENTAHLNDDVANGRTTEQNRIEWNTGSEFYNHFASHHGTCYAPSPTAAGGCGDPNAPKPREAYDPNDPGAQCAAWEKSFQPSSNCYAEDVEPTCGSDGVGTSGFRNATQLPGRLAIPLPDGRGVASVEDQIWGCNHHVVTQLPPGSYGMTELANYRLQKGGITNDKTNTIYGTAPGAVFGGSVGEMIIQAFASANDAGVKPLNVSFNAVGDAATTFYPPYTWSYHESEWTPPFDAAIALSAIHSHHRMVKGIMNMAPANTPRLQSPNRDCGGWLDGQAPPPDLYTDWYWEDAPVCEYWKDPDGPVTIRKGQIHRTICYVNNGVTPEAIKHGLVASSAVQTLKELGAPIPEYPALVPASTWGAPLAESPVGEELLYGKHPPINYRVRYACGAAPNVTVPVPFAGGVGCDPNPAVDGDGDYVDGPYENAAQCAEDGGWCNPSMIVFACVGEDEMCIGVSMYWALPRLGSDRNDEAVENLGNADADHVGTPGSLGTPPDVTGTCPECEWGL